MSISWMTTQKQLQFGRIVYDRQTDLPGAQVGAGFAGGRQGSARKFYRICRASEGDSQVDPARVRMSIRYRYKCRFFPVVDHEQFKRFCGQCAGVDYAGLPILLVAGSSGRM